MNQSTRFKMHWQYYQICREHVRQYESITKEIEKHKSSSDEIYIIEMNVAALTEQRVSSVLIPIPFAAMCLEAFVYDYAATSLGDGFVKKHLDKLELPSKFVVSSKLITGNEFSTDSQAYEGLKKLITDRNKLVHFKSKAIPADKLEVLGQYHDEYNEYLPDAMYNAYDTVKNVLMEIDKIHNNDTQFWDSISYENQCHA